MSRYIKPVALAVFLAAFSSVLVAPMAHAKQQCSAAQPASLHGRWWSYRIIDGRKCWYEGKPGLSKSLLEWPARTSPRTPPKEELAEETPGNPLDAQAWAPPTGSNTFEELWRTR